ncbi:extracellular solute-binding protein [Methylocapsa palsarum]|uniref:Putrescine-binding periplasmic protein n=1 Tax=Methylocapsa palsarum TaxID=1612308 RepID=A0A1I3YTA7_9HYPH|nr:extracellular solute-binding protein [Methylocapsa palsarum]SFK35082.1 putrescine transport system substrate-binding protein [Methylocapsa palsarum]
MSRKASSKQLQSSFVIAARRAAALWVVALCAVWPPAPGFALEKSVSVFGWSDAVDPAVLRDFTKETGVRVFYDAYASEEALEARLAAGDSGYDVAILPGPVLQRQIAAGGLLKLDKAKLPHAASLWPEIATLLSAYDRGNQYAANYLWSTAGVAYNVEEARARLGEAPLNSWDVVFKPEILKKFADCGIYVLDSPQDLFPIALNYLRLNPAGKSQADLKRAADLLGGMRRYVKKYTSADYADALANGDICLAVGWSGESVQARNRAKEADNQIDVDFVAPKEGTLIALDNLAILKDAPHPSEAYALIDFLLRPENAARNTNATRLASGVLEAKSLIKREISDLKATYPDPQSFSRLFAAPMSDAAARAFAAREWMKIKSGK